jgi:anti-anti-sigma factor
MDGLAPESDAPISFDVAIDAAGAATVTINGELDIATIDVLDERVAPVLARRPPRLIVDVRDVRFADSSAIAMWVRWSAAVNDFELRNPPPLIRRVLTAMGLAEKLAVTP